VSEIRVALSHIDGFDPDVITYAHQLAIGDMQALLSALEN
jgi:hypothetical protein